jgi:Domain of unknown function (DUF4276)
MMRRVCVVCEGQTEETFVRQVMAPVFYPLNINLVGETIQTSPGNKGGALNYDRVKRHLVNRLRQANAATVTTFFDYYRLDSRFPGYEAALQKNGISNKLQLLNQHLHEDIVNTSGCVATRFIPHIQPYEFEALLFSDVKTLTAIEPMWASKSSALQAVRDAASSPEHINDSPETKPAAHLELQLTSPSFRKRLHGPIAAEKIGLHKIEAECAAFAAWINMLRGI